MTTLAQAQALGAAGFWVFELRELDKRPRREGWQQEATRTPTSWTPGSNLGIFCEKFGDDGQAVVAVDIDCKAGKDGHEALFALEIEGFELPPTFRQSTPSGGEHDILLADRPVAPSVSKIGRGIDIRSAGSYIVGPGSVLKNGVYAPLNRLRPAMAPAWLLERAGAPATRAVRPVDGLTDLVRAQQRGAEYLKTAPRSVKGDGGDQTAYIVASKLKDLGCDRTGSLMLMMSEHWHDGCGWSEDRLREKIDHAWLYGKEAPGIAAPETVFTVVEPFDDAKLHPFDELNKSFAWTVAGGVGTILWERQDADGAFALDMISEPTFRQMHASRTLATGTSVQPLTTAWMKSPERRSYQGLVFEPGREVPGFYNLFRGFSTSPLPTDVDPSVAAVETWERFVDHLRVNVARDNAEHFHWIMGYICGIFQRPAERPNVALVATGRKGAGKSIIAEIVSNLLGDYFVSVSDSERLFARFNSAFERALVAVLEEAVWSGDHRQDSKLKDLITASHRNIERKGFEPFRVRNYLRVFILGNEKWIVPATADDRRYAVFSVAGTRAEDREYFAPLYDNILHARTANEHVRQFFVRQLMAYSCADVDLTVAPKTEHLAAQVNESVAGPIKFIRNCLASASLPARQFGGMSTPWPDDTDLLVLKTAMHDAYVRTARDRMESRPVDQGQFFAALVQAGIRYESIRPAGQPRHAVFASLDVARKQYEKHIGGRVDWGD